MNLDAVGNLAELLGSLGVFASLFYLALQIKKNTEAERTATYRAIVSDFGALNQTMAATPELSMLFAEGLERFHELTPDEKARLSQLFFQAFHYFENMYYQHRKGYIEPELWHGWERLMLTYAARPGLKRWWALRRDAFSAPFVAFLESAPQPTLPSYQDVTRIS